MIFDCVQFPRRGWVHRNKFISSSGEKQWLTLPVTKASIDTSIKDMLFSQNARQLMIERLKKFPQLNNALESGNLFMSAVENIQDEDTLASYLIRNITMVNEYLGFDIEITRSSELPIDHSLKGEEKIISIVKYLRGTEYFNLPGGRNLYSQTRFSREGINLNILDEWKGSFDSILSRLLTEDKSKILCAIREN